MKKKLSEMIGGGAKPLLLLLGVLGLVLLLVGSVGEGCEGREPTTPSEDSSPDAYRIALAEEAEMLCREVAGVGEVQIMLTLESGESNTYSGSHVTSTTPPRILGVAVVAEGGNSDMVKQELTELLSALFHVGANRIHISPAKQT